MDRWWAVKIIMGLKGRQYAYWQVTLGTVVHISLEGLARTACGGRYICVYLHRWQVTENLPSRISDGTIRHQGCGRTFHLSNGRHGPNGNCTMT